MSLKLATLLRPPLPLSVAVLHASHVMPVHPMPKLNRDPFPHASANVNVAPARARLCGEPTVELDLFRGRFKIGNHTRVLMLVIVAAPSSLGAANYICIYPACVGLSGVCACSHSSYLAGRA